MTVSVVIPTYNRNGLLFGRALPSVLRQQHPVDEILIVADGMVGRQLDELEHNVRHLQFEAPMPLRLWNIPHQSYPQGNEWGLLAVAARNHGLDKAKGEWVSLLDDDDEMLPNNVELLLAEAERTGADFVYGRSMTFKNGIATGQIYGTYPPRDGAITHGAFLMRRSLGYRYALDCYDRGRNADADLWIRMFEAGVRFHNVPEIVHRYHRNWP